MAICEYSGQGKHDGIKVCGHGSDYSVLYESIRTRHVMCHSCWNEETHVRVGKDSIRVFREWQLRAVDVVCLGCGTDVTALGGCSRCHPER